MKNYEFLSLALSAGMIVFYSLLFYFDCSRQRKAGGDNGNFSLFRLCPYMVALLLLIIGLLSKNYAFLYASLAFCVLLLITTMSDMNKLLLPTVSIFILFISILFQYLGLSLWIPHVYALIGCVISAYLIFKGKECHVLFANLENFEEENKESLAEQRSEPKGNPIIYMGLYVRLVTYMEKSKPYLNPELKMDDVARDLYSNRVYLSRAIKLGSEKNYCQFINSYRVAYAVDCLKRDPHLRMNQVADKSGFRSGAAFNVAFRAEMDMSPGEWARAYREGRLK